MGRILGVDYGDKHIGVAMSDALELTAQRLTRIEHTSMPQDIEAILKLAQEHGVSAIVVGLPLTMQGAQGPQAKKVVGFCDALRRKALEVPVHLVDERLTTAQGQKALLETDTSRRKRKTLIDQVAAQLILQHYLDAQRR